MPPARPVADVCSRANASLDELVDVVGAAGVADERGERADHVVLRLAERGVEAHQRRDDEVGHGSISLREVEVGDLDQGGVHLVGVGDRGAGQACGGAAVGDGEGQPVGRRPLLGGGEEVAEEAGVARSDGADDGGRRRGGVPGAPRR